MQITNLIKEDSIWFIHSSEYLKQGGAKKDLELEDESREIVERLAEGKSTVSLKACINPFEGCDLLILDELATPSVGGAYYIIKTLGGSPLNKRVWLRDLLLFQFQDTPERIYFKRVEP